jgi:nitrate/nitrite-specific signal transduction histidine kinase
MTKKGTEFEGHEVVSLFEKGLSFTKELLAENERLRFRLASLEAELDAGRRLTRSVEAGGVLDALRQQVIELEAERARLMTSYAEVEGRNRDYLQRYAEIEAEHADLAKLYIASYQLHASLSFREVIQVVSEIIINLVGVAAFTLYVYDSDSERLEPLVAEGHDAGSMPPIELAEPVVGRAAQTRERYIRAGPAASGPVAVIPLSTMESLVGVIVIEALLVQKSWLGHDDLELFTLLGGHAATAMASALMREQASPEARMVSASKARELLR